jgi:hypothetical protein
MILAWMSQYHRQGDPTSVRPSLDTLARIPLKDDHNPNCTEPPLMLGICVWVEHVAHHALPTSLNVEPFMLLRNISRHRRRAPTMTCSACGGALVTAQPQTAETRASSGSTRDRTHAHVSCQGWRLQALQRRAPLTGQGPRLAADAASSGREIGYMVELCLLSSTSGDIVR